MQIVSQIFQKMPLRIQQKTPFQAKEIIFSGDSIFFWGVV